MSNRQLQEAQAIVRNAQQIVSFSGAGLSAESGVPTFRDAETHPLWKTFSPMDLASPEGFAANPQRVMDWYNWRRQQIADTKPNPAHLALAQHPQLLNISQNVDDLLERAGCPPDRLAQLHGTLTKDRCHRPCGHTEIIELRKPRPLRQCPQCGDWMRPAVVWFGETLPASAWDCAEQWANNADVLLVIGTSASVYPAAGLIQTTKAAGGKVIVLNTQSSGASDLADIEIIGACGILLPVLLA